MKNRNCCGDQTACDIPVDLPDDYLETLYAMYVKDAKAEGKIPLQKEDWLKTIS